MSAVRRAGRFLVRFRRAQDGATAIEYALIAVGVSIVIAATVTAVGTNLKVNFYDKMEAATQN